MPTTIATKTIPNPPRALSPHDDLLAALLGKAGFSFRQIGILLGCSDKTAKTAAERGESNEPRLLTAKQQKLADELLGLHRWLAEGRQQGYLASLAVILLGQGQGD